MTTTKGSTISSIPSILSKAEEENAIERFQTFLRYETVSATAPTTGEYKKCANFLLQQLRSIPNNVLTDIHLLPEAPDHSPVVIAKWQGKKSDDDDDDDVKTDTDLPIILLNSHYDVVPADASAWTVPPFEAIRKDGKIYGRGAQDMKCVCMQYIEAIRYLASSTSPTFQPARTIYLTFVPDEEIGGQGMAAFLESSLYKDVINKGTGQHTGIALALDEGLASTNNVFDVFYGERLPWWVDVTAKGPTGHGSRFIEPTAVGSLLELTQKALAFRTGQKRLLDMSQHENCTHAVVASKRKKAQQQQQRKNGPSSSSSSSSAKVSSLGDVTSLNITTLQAGVRVGNTYAYNCVPAEASCSLDIRISPHVPPIDIKNMLDTWCQECSSPPECQLEWSYLKDQNSAMEHATTNTDRKVNPWYDVFVSALESDELKSYKGGKRNENDDDTTGIRCTIAPQVFPAATDSRFLRALGIRALGFSPMRDTEILLHEHDEYILERNFIEGITIYVTLIRTLSSKGEEMEEKISDQSQRGQQQGQSSSPATKKQTKS